MKEMIGAFLILMFFAHMFPGFFRAPIPLIVPLASIGAISIAHAESPNTVGMPIEEDKFITAIQHAKDRYASGSNDMQKGASRPTRAREICAALPSLQIQNWIGTIEGLSSNSDGQGVVSIKIDEDIFIKTWNNSLSDLEGGTLVDPESPLFNEVSALSKGEKVFFSGSFFPNQTDCVREGSLTLQGSITSPEFIMKFSDISLNLKQAAPAPINRIVPDASIRSGTLAAQPSISAASTPKPQKQAPMTALPAPEQTAPPPAPAPAYVYIAPTPVLHVPPREIRAQAHPEWKPLKVDSREFREIQESCSTLPANQVSYH